MIKNKHILKFFANASLLIFAFTIISLNAAVTDWPEITNSPKNTVVIDWPEITNSPKNATVTDCPEIVIDWISKA